MNMGRYTAEDDEASETEMLDICIAKLEFLQNEAKKLVDVRRRDNVATQNRLIKLIGNKPVIKCTLDDKDVKVLWDTGSMISLVSLAWLKENFPDVSLLPISALLEDSKGEVRFVAANKTEVVMVGCVILNFTIGENSFPVPFLVSESELAQPLLGYNVIEYLIKTAKPEDTVKLLKHSFSEVEASKVEVVANVISKAIEDDD